MKRNVPRLENPSFMQMSLLVHDIMILKFIFVVNNYRLLLALKYTASVMMVKIMISITDMPITKPMIHH